MEDFSRNARDFLKEVKSVAKVKRLIVSIVVGVCFFKEIRPNFHGSTLIFPLAVDEVRLRLPSIILSNWHIVINNNILPHVFLENLNQVNPKVTDFASLKHFGEH